MEIVVKARLAAPPESVFAAYRDQIDRFAVDVENVERVEISSYRAVDPGSAHVTHLWRARSWIPDRARRWIRSEMLVWDADVQWWTNELRCDWEITPRHFRDCVTCRGEIRFEPRPGGATMTMTAQLEITVAPLGVIPRLLQGFVERRVEQFIATRVEPNFRAVAAACERELGGATVVELRPVLA